MNKLLILIGILFIVAGFLYPWVKKIGFGHLPGDIFIRKGNFIFYFPLTTCILISLIIMLIFWLLNR